MTILPHDFSWLTALIAVGTLSSMVFGFVRMAKAWTRSRVDRRWDQSYRDIGLVYETIQELMSATPANRVLVLKSENGGGIPTPDGAVTNTVTHEVCDSQVDVVRKLWSGIELDQSYSEAITRVSAKGSAVIELSTLPQSSTLAELLRHCECEQARFVRICATGSALLYLCVCTGRGESLESTDRLRVRAAAQQLCGIFANHHPLIKREARDT